MIIIIKIIIIVIKYFKYILNIECKDLFQIDVEIEEQRYLRNSELELESS